MSVEDRTLLWPDLKRVGLERRMELVAANRPITTIYFPEGGVASIVATNRNGERTEVGIFGREGFSAASLLLGSDETPHETFMQIDGSTALSIGATELRTAANKSVTLRDLLLRYINSFMIQTASSVVSNAHNSIEIRLARWLLMCHDRTDGDDIHLTHEFMAMMIAAQRSGVTLTLHVLEGYGPSNPVAEKSRLRTVPGWRRRQENPMANRREFTGKQSLPLESKAGRYGQ